jgi:hypothetical protein
MEGDNWDGAGAIPYCFHENQVLFLLQETKGGKKEGKLVDFGGGRKTGVDTDLMVCGAREFTEETAGLFTTETVEEDCTAMEFLDFNGIEACPSVKREVERCLSLVKKAKDQGLVWHSNLKKIKFYASFALEINYTDLKAQNSFFSRPSVKKVRVFQWVPSDIFLSLIKAKKGQGVQGWLPLHNRLFCLENLVPIIERIVSMHKSPTAI